MRWTSVLAIYCLLWVLSAFIVMPFGLRTHDDDAVEKVRGQADSAPHNFRPGRVALRATLLAAVFMGLFYANYANDWVEIGDLNVFGEPPPIKDIDAY